MRFRWLTALAVALLSSGLAAAQPKAAEPTVEVRLRSVDDLVTRFEYVAGLAGQEGLAGQVRDFIKAITTDGKGIEGIDPKKPIGVYATLDTDIATSPVIVLVPVLDEKTFLAALAKYNLTPEKGDDGTHKVALPLPGLDAVHLRFANDYAYISQKASDLNPKTLLAPKAFFAKDDGAAASLLVHLDRVPDDLKKFLIGQVELGIAEQREKEQNQSAGQKKLSKLIVDSFMSAVKGVSEDGKNLSVKVFADEKTDELSAEVSLTAKSGSATAKNFAGLAGKTSLPAGIVATAAPAARANAKLAVTDDKKKEFAAAIDTLLAEAIKEAPDDQGKEVLKRLVAAVGPTLKAGELDAAVSFVGPDAKDRYQLLAALAVKDGKGIETFAKKFDAEYGEMLSDFVAFKFDVETIGDFTLHRVDVKAADDNFEQVFGTKTVWLATSEKYLALSIEPDGKLIRAGLKAKAIPVAVASVDAAAAKLLALAPNLKADERKALLKDAFGDGPTAGKDAVSLTVEAGDRLTVKFNTKGKVIRLGTAFDALKGK